MPEFNLYIYPIGDCFKEKLTLPLGTSIDLPMFGITNAFLSVSTSLSSPISNDQEDEVFRKLSAYFDLEGDIHKHLPKEISETSESYFAHYMAQAHYKPQKGHFETTLLFNSTWRNNDIKRIQLFLEGLALRQALRIWLLPQGKGRVGGKNRQTPSQRFSYLWQANQTPQDFWYLWAEFNKWSAGLINSEDWLIPHLTILPYEALTERSKQFNSLIAAFKLVRTKRGSSETIKYIQDKIVTAEQYSSKDGLMPLLWAEITHAVRHDIYAKNCPVCGKWFSIPKGNRGYKFNQIYCTTDCRREAERQINKNDRNYRGIKRLQTKRARTTSPEEKNKLTQEIKKLQGRRLIEDKEIKNTRN